MLARRNRTSARLLGVRYPTVKAPPGSGFVYRRRTMAALDHFRQELHLQMDRAVTWGAKAVVINARDLHSALGDFLEPKHQPTCCDMMEQEMIEGDVVVLDKSDAEGLTIQ